MGKINSHPTCSQNMEFSSKIPSQNFYAQFIDLIDRYGTLQFTAFSPSPALGNSGLNVPPHESVLFIETDSHFAFVIYIKTYSLKASCSAHIVHIPQTLSADTLSGFAWQNSELWKFHHIVLGGQLKGCYRFIFFYCKINFLDFAIINSSSGYGIRQCTNPWFSYISSPQSRRISYTAWTNSCSLPFIFHMFILLVSSNN